MEQEKPTCGRTGVTGGGKTRLRGVDDPSHGRTSETTTTHVMSSTGLEWRLTLLLFVPNRDTPSLKQDGKETRKSLIGHPSCHPFHVGDKKRNPEGFRRTGDSSTVMDPKYTTTRTCRCSSVGFSPSPTSPTRTYWFLILVPSM